MVQEISLIWFKSVSVNNILDLRHRVLRAGLPVETARFEGDEDQDTRHVAAYIGTEAAPVGCASFMLNPYNRVPAWQLRGMATDESYRGKGIGKQLLSWTIKDLSEEPDHAFVDLLWCNARESAVPFYEQNGWKRDSKKFHIPTAGPHYKMIKSI